jgi:hypothetical protein
VSALLNSVVGRLAQYFAPRFLGVKDPFRLLLGDLVLSRLLLLI